MYADREEAALETRRASGSNGKRSRSDRILKKHMSPDSAHSSLARSVSSSISSQSPRSEDDVDARSRGDDDDDDDDEALSDKDPSDGRRKESLDVREREKQLQEKLRKRAIMSKRRKRSDSSTIARSHSGEVNEGDASADRKRSDQRRERRRGGGVELLERRISDRNGRERTRRASRSISRSVSRSRSRSPSRSRRRLESVGSKRGSSKRLSPEDDEHERRRRKVERSEDGHDDSSAYRRDREGGRERSRQYSPYYDPYYDRSMGRGYYPPGPPRRGGYPDYRYGPPPRDEYFDAPRSARSRHTRSPSPPARRRRDESKAKSPDPDDYELRSVFCSQLAARLGQRDLGEFFEDKLGEGSVRDVRIITDKNTGRSKGIGYVELKDEALVQKAVGFSGTPLFGIPLLVQLTEAARNRGQGASSADTPIRPNLPALTAEQLASLPKINGQPIHIDPANLTGSNPATRLYVGSLHFNLTEDDIKAVFEPFGAILNVDLHREPGTLKSKGFCFIQFASAGDAEKAIQNMNGFDLAGRQIKVGHVASRGSGPAAESSGGGGGGGGGSSSNNANNSASFDASGASGLNAASRAALMEKLARKDQTSSSAPSVPSEQQRPLNIPEAVSKAVLLKNMFNPEEETERGWDKELAEDVKEECEDKYGKVTSIKVDTDSAGEIWLKFEEVNGATKAIAGLNGRFFGGRSISAAFVSEGIFTSMLS
ncbi:hypothetical protein CBS101457_000756 [Exobasidium rhododendri]|nr:hypothetical protein CBS101457_000756 [Exobasidium rhododendri]